MNVPDVSASEEPPAPRWTVVAWCSMSNCKVASKELDAEERNSSRPLRVGAHRRLEDSSPEELVGVPARSETLEATLGNPVDLGAGEVAHHAADRDAHPNTRRAALGLDRAAARASVRISRTREIVPSAPNGPTGSTCRTTTDSGPASSARQSQTQGREVPEALGSIALGQARPFAPRAPDIRTPRGRSFSLALSRQPPPAAPCIECSGGALFPAPPHRPTVWAVARVAIPFCCPSPIDPREQGSNLSFPRNDRSDAEDVGKTRRAVGGWCA
jgi:hypothetical protein